MKTLKTIVSGMAILAFALFFFEHPKQLRARAEILSLRQEKADLMAEKERLPSSVIRSESSSSLGTNEMRELLRLRSEVDRLRQQISGIDRSRPAISPTTPTGVNTSATPTHLAFGTELQDMGTTTPERAASSLVWAVLNG